MARRPWMEDDDQILRELHALGKTNHEIAKEMGRSPGSISTHVRMLGLPPRQDESTKVATKYRLQDAKVIAAQRLEERNRLVSIVLQRAFEINDILDQRTIPSWIPTQGGGREMKHLKFDELPHEQMEAIHRMLVKSCEMAAKIDSMKIPDNQVEEETKSLLASTAEVLMRRKPDLSILEANREPRPEEVGADE